MTAPAAFRITKDRLHSVKSFVKTLELSNGTYDIKLSYAGEYDDDRDNGKLEPSLLSMTCTAHDMMPDIGIHRGQLLLLQPSFQYTEFDKADQLADKIRESRLHAEALREAAEPYFPFIHL